MARSERIRGRSSSLVPTRILSDRAAEEGSSHDRGFLTSASRHPLPWSSWRDGGSLPDIPDSPAADGTLRNLAQPRTERSPRCVAWLAAHPFRLNARGGLGNQERRSGSANRGSFPWSRPRQWTSARS
jgi:hypothetical protein